MHLTQKQKLMLAIGIFALSGFVLYNTFAGGGSSPVVAEPTVDANGVVIAVENQDIVDLANKFDQISIDINLFSSNLFQNLRDLEVPLLPESSGRPNPFAPIGSDVGTVSTSVNTSSTTKQTTR